jgi:hypothetical protein
LFLLKEQAMKRRRDKALALSTALAAVSLVLASGEIQAESARERFAREKTQVDPEPDDPLLWFFTVTKDGRGTKFGNFPYEYACEEALGLSPLSPVA